MIKITKGKQVAPQRVVIYGPEGVGKSSFASGLEAPIFLDAEKSTQELDVARAEINSVRDMEQALAFLRDEPHQFKTVILDTIDWYEEQIANSLCKKYKCDSITEIRDGFNNGYVILAEELQKFLCALNKLSQTANVHVALLAHSEVTPFKDPMLSSTYDRYSLKLTKKCKPLLKEWAEAQLFYNYDTKLADHKGTFGSKRGVGGSVRTIHTTHTAAYDAKNRHGLDESISVPTAGEVPQVFFEKVFRKLDAPKPTEVTETPTEAPSEFSEIVKQAGGESVVGDFLFGRGEKFPPSEDYQKRVLENPEAFIKAVKEGV